MHIQCILFSTSLIFILLVKSYTLYSIYIYGVLYCMQVVSTRPLQKCRWISQILYSDMLFVSLFYENELFVVLYSGMFVSVAYCC